MSVAVLEAPTTATLEDVLTGAWAALARDHAASCPICHGEMAPRWSAAGIVGGRCEDCGTTLE